MLGPLFLVIFISDLPEIVLPGNTIALHADDSKCSRIIDAADDQDLFQKDQDSFFQWSVRNCMNLNVHKCKIMTLTKKKHPYISSFTLNNFRLDEVKEFKDLGVVTNEHLSWNSYVGIVVAEANRMLGLIKRTSRSLDDSRTLKTLYCTLIRFNLDYGSVVWSPYTKRNIEKLERVLLLKSTFL